MTDLPPVTDIPNITDCGCPDEKQKPLNESDATSDSCGDLATYPEPCPKGLMDLYCTKFTGSADPVFGVAPGDRGSTVLVKIMNKIKSLHGLGVPATLLPVNNIIVSNITGTTVNLSWGAVAGATLYDVRYRRNSQPDWLYVNALTVLNIQLINLVPNNTYLYEIRARDATTGYSEWTATASFTTLGQPAKLATPTGLIGSSTITNQFVASWNNVLGATSYEVRVKISGNPELLMIVPAATNSVVVNVPDGATYYDWQVLAKNNLLIDSDLSAPLSTQVKGMPPSNLAISSITQVSAVLTFTRPYATAPLRFELRLQSGVGGTLDAHTGSNAADVSWSIVGLTPNTMYEIRGYNQTTPTSDIAYKSFVTLP